MGNLTGLHFAAMSDQGEVITFLLEKRADPTLTTPKGARAIHLAVVCGNINALRSLHLALGHDILNSQSDDGRTPLHEAADAGNGPMVRYLLAHGANRDAKDKEGFTALALAEREKNDEVLKVFEDVELLT